MNTVVIYLIKFIEVMVVSCVFNPSNWDQCWRVNEWMSPYVKDFQEFQAKPPYSEEEKKWREYHTGVQAADDELNPQR
ncbi:hypothetical protein [Synechococcus sp. MIT S9452]|uniref:hypothetical protein n=1 Tax=Synechococcus sp. MIT S9452 TaxID=3082546 RepID=UPI0039A411C9